MVSSSFDSNISHYLESIMSPHGILVKDILVNLLAIGTSSFYLYENI